MPNPTFSERITQELEKLNVGDSFDKFIIINDIKYDYFDDPYRNFDKYLSNIKKKYPSKKFRTIKGRVTRLE